MADVFKCISVAEEGHYKEKGSAFLSYAFPLNAESEVKIHLNQLRKAHPKARHICHAYRFGQDIHYYKASDDGEPSGTGGKPILGAIRSHELENILIAVVRYFGGTLLGAAALGKAYHQSAFDAIKSDNIVSVRRNVYYTLSFDFPTEKHLIPWLHKHAGIKINSAYLDKVSYTIKFPLSMEDAVETLINNAAIELQWPGKVECIKTGKDLF